MSDPDAPGPIVCASCGAESENPPADRCWVCRRPFVAAKPAVKAGAGARANAMAEAETESEAGPAPTAATRARRGERVSRDRWADRDAPKLEAAPLLTGILVIVGVSIAQPGLGILLALCGLPILLSGGAGRGPMGCVSAAVISVGILIATTLAFFATCSATQGRTMTLPVLVTVFVFVGLTVAASRSASRSVSRASRASAARRGPP